MEFIPSACVSVYAGGDKPTYCQRHPIPRTWPWTRHSICSVCLTMETRKRDRCFYPASFCVKCTNHFLLVYINAAMETLSFDLCCSCRYYLCVIWTSCVCLQHDSNDSKDTIPLFSCRISVFSTNWWHARRKQRHWWAEQHAWQIFSLKPVIIFRGMPVIV